MELTRKVENLNREIEGFNRRQLDNETNYKELEAKCKTVTDELDAIQSEIGNL